MKVYKADNSVHLNVEDEVFLESSGITIFKFKQSLLNSKELFLIDVFNTFIEPIHPFSGKNIYDQVVREGFCDFLKHNYLNGKKIGLHTDSMGSDHLVHLSNYWRIKEYIHEHFGNDYMKHTHKKDSNGKPILLSFLAFKDFKKMAKKINIPLEKSLVIGDGYSDLLGAFMQKVDILLVPSYNCNENFDFKSLI
mgnify:CR=1 FL=1